MSRRTFTARLAGRTLLRSRRYAALVLLTIAVPVAAGTATATIAQSLQLTPQRQLDGLVGPEAEAWIDAYQRPGIEQSPGGTVRPDVDAPTTDAPILEDYESALAAALGPTNELHRFAAQVTRLTTESGRYRDGAHVIELDLGVAQLAATFPLDAGRHPERVGEVVVDQPLAASLDLKVGATAKVIPAAGGVDASDDDRSDDDRSAVDVEVVGVVAPTAGMTERLAVVGLPGTALSTPDRVGGGVSLRWFVTGAPVTWDQVLAVNALGSVVMSRAVLDDPPPAEQVAFADSRPLTGEEVSLAVIGGLAAVMILALLVAPSFAVGAHRSRRELGMLAAAGAERRDLRHVVLWQGVVAGVVAAAVGVIVGLGIGAAVRIVASWFGSVALPDLRVPWTVIALIVAVGLMAAVAGAWWPARGVARDDPIAAITGRTLIGASRPTYRVLRSLVVLLVGVAVSVAGVVTASAVILAAGAFVLFIACLLLIGPLVGLVARVARGVNTPARYAFRDADRRRSRTVPAIAGVVAVVALAVATGAFSASHYSHALATWAAPSGVGTVRVSTAGPGAAGPGWARSIDAETWQRASVSLAESVPLDGAVTPVLVGMGAGSAVSDDPPQVLSTPVDEIEIADWRGNWRPAKWANPFPLIDDGTVVSRLGVPGGAEAAAALASGHLVVWTPALMTAGGTVEISVGVAGAMRAAEVPAEAVDLGTLDYFTIFPTSLADELGLEAVQVGLVATLDGPVDIDDENALRATLDAIIPGVEVAVERGPQADGAATATLLGIVAALIVIAAAALCIALAAADARPDLATLAAIGAPARVRRGIATTTGALILSVGTVLGTVIGLAFAAALVVVRRYEGGNGVDIAWQLQIPWTLLGLLVVAAPAIVLAGAYLLTPKRLPLTRRIST